MDREHDALTCSLQVLIQQVCDGNLGAANTHLNILMKQLDRHCQSEEQPMVTLHDPLLARHTDAHRGFTRDAAKHIAAFREHGLTPEFRRWVLERFSKWFDFHIRANEVALGRHLCGHPNATAQPPAGRLTDDRQATKVRPPFARSKTRHSDPAQPVESPRRAASSVTAARSSATGMGLRSTGVSPSGPPA